MNYKKQEIQEYFDDFIIENKKYLEREHPDTWKDDLHHEAFNSDYYICYTYDAKQWLGDQIFNIIDFIKEYEQFNFGEVTTDFSCLVAIVNMYVYIIGEEIVWDYINQLEVA